MGHFTETFRGSALAWEADELGHVNMRYYFGFIAEARAIFCAKLGLKNIYKAEGFSTLVPVRQHIKYHKELRPGHGVVVHTGILAMHENSMDVVHMVSNPGAVGENMWRLDDYSGVLTATIVETINHVAVRTGEKFEWPDRMQGVAQSMNVELSQYAAARNIDVEETLSHPSLEKADELGLMTIGQGMYGPNECDVFGKILPVHMVGRISNSVQHLSTAWPELDFSGNSDITGALIEACAHYREMPEAGDCFVIRSGLRSANIYTSELCHWILDPVTGKCWGSFVGVGCRFNMATRKLVKLDEATLIRVQSGILQGIGP